MSDSIMLVSAVLAALTSGVLIAYGICLGMFRVFQIRAEQVSVESQPIASAVAQIVEG